MQMPQRHLSQMEQATSTQEQMYDALCQAALSIHERLSLNQCRPILTGDLSYAANYALPAHCHVSQTEFFFPFETQGKKADDWADYSADNVDYEDKHTMHYDWQGYRMVHRHKLFMLSNKLTGHGFQSLLEEELRESRTFYVQVGGQSIETLPPTLTLFHLLFTMSHNMLSHVTTMNDLIHVGVLLRSTGDRVDFVKIQSWIERLKLTRMTQLIGQLLIELLGFEKDELPFASFEKPVDTRRMKQEIMVPAPSTGRDMSFSQAGGSIFVHAGNRSAMMWHARRSLKFMKYYPSESIANFFSSFARSITNIEE